MILIHRLRSIVRWTFRRQEAEQELSDELRDFIERSTSDKIVNGMSPKEADRTSRIELGGVAQVKEGVRSTRGLAWLGGFGLDVKLGLRMLRKSWGLTLVGGLAMTVAMGIGVVVFGFLHTTFWSALPLDEGDRVVALMNYDAVANRRRSPSFQDFERWRDVLQSVEEVGAFRTIERSLVIGNGSAEPVPATVSIAKITASAFGLARVPPLLGRPLVEEDERKGAPPVVVIGHDVWRTRFASDPSVVGQRVRLGGTVHGVVGVMPEGFAFPVNHSFWTPLGAFPSDFTEGGASEVIVFARLAAGVTLEAAEAELETVGLLPSLTAPETLRQLLPRVVPYTLALVSPGESLERWIFWLALSLVTLLLVPPCANIAILVYARTVTRHEEFAARYALARISQEI